MRVSLVCSFFLLSASLLHAQVPIYLDSLNPKAHARGLAISDQVIYVGDNLGRCFKYFPSSNELHAIRQVGPEIRDIAITAKGVLWMQTGDTGKVFKDDAREPILFPVINGKSVFLDGIACRDSLVFAMGDPVDNEFALFFSKNYGRTWETIRGVMANPEEAAYAASGSTVQLDSKHLYFVSGGETSRFWVRKIKGKRWKSFDIPYKKESGEGPYSLCVIDPKHMVVVGGNYQFPNRRSSVCYISNNGGKSWKESAEPPFGYRSDVIYFQGVTYACGSNGIDFSTDLGNTWVKWLPGAFIAMDISADEKLWITTNSKLGLLMLEPVKIDVLIND